MEPREPKCFILVSQAQQIDWVALEHPHFQLRVVLKEQVDQAATSLQTLAAQSLVLSMALAN